MKDIRSESHLKLRSNSAQSLKSQGTGREKELFLPEKKGLISTRTDSNIEFDLECVICLTEEVQKLTYEF